MNLLSRSFPRTSIAVAVLLSALGAAPATAADWTPLAPAEHARSEGTLVVHDGGVFHLNGFDRDIRLQNSVERYDLAADDWRTVAETTDSPAFPTALTHSGVVVVDGETWLIGGRVGNHPGKVTDRVVILDLDTYDWREGPALPLPFAGGGAAVVGRHVHVFGGLDAQARCDVDTHLVYDLDAPGAGWRDLSDDAPFSRPRNHFGTVVMDDLIYVIGGQIGHDNCASLAKQRTQTKLVDVYDPASGEWRSLANLPWPQSHTEPSTFVHAGRIWSVGGLVNGQRVLSYEPAANAWTWRRDLELPSRLLAPGARIFDGNRLHLFGGGAPDVRNPRAATWVMEVPGLTGVPSSTPSEDAPTPDAPAPDPVVPSEPGDTAPPSEPPLVVDDTPRNDDGADGGDLDPAPEVDEPIDVPEAPTPAPITIVDDMVRDDDGSGDQVVAPAAPVAPVAPVGPFAPIDDGEPSVTDDPVTEDFVDERADVTGTSRSGGGGAAWWVALLLAARFGARRAARAISR